MASPPAVEQLVQLAGNLSLADEQFPNFWPESNPLDVYRAHLTNILHAITGVDIKIIYPAVQWTTGLDKGDMIVAIPALRVKGRKPDELVKEYSEKVRTRHGRAPLGRAAMLTTTCCYSSPRTTPCSPSPSSTATSCSSGSSPAP